MNATNLAYEYLRKSKNRLEAVKVLFEKGSYDDVIRECQEIVELVLKGVLRFIGIDPPHIHDVGMVLKKNSDRLPSEWNEKLDEITELSTKLAAERSIAFYGDEQDFQPLLNIYDKLSTEEIMNKTQKLVELFEKSIQR